MPAVVPFLALPAGVRLRLVAIQNAIAAVQSGAVAYLQAGSADQGKASQGVAGIACR
jgi:hypothetical protein